MEHTVIVFCREDEEILAVLFNDVIVPHLLLCPGYILYVQNYSVVGSFTILHVVERQHVVVFHLEVASVIVEGMSCLSVVRGVDIQFAVKNIG